MGLREQQRMRSLWLFAVTVHSSNCTANRSRRLLDHSRELYGLIKLSAAIFLLGFAVFAAFPTYDLLCNGHLTLFLAVYIPGVDPHGAGGFALNVLMQLVMSVYAAAGNMTFDLFMMMVVLLYRSYVTLLQCQLNRFAVLYAGRPSARKLAYRRAFLRNVLLQFADIIE